MRRALDSALALLVAIAAALAAAAVALPRDAVGSDLAAQLLPVDLRVAGGEGTWNPLNTFSLYWDRPPVAEQGFPITGGTYRVRDAAGDVLSEAHFSGDYGSTGGIKVPSQLPGLYTVDLWLEGPKAALGPRSSATLRYDNARPGLARPSFPAVWIGGSQAAIIEIGHPPEPLPISGIRGYAVSVDGGEGSLPCSGQERCTVAETDLPGGIDDDEISIGKLREGTHFVRAVAVSGSGMRSSQVTTAIVRVDLVRPETSLAGARTGWVDGPVRLTAMATDSMSGMAANGPGDPFTAIAVDGGVPRAEPGPSTTAVVSGQGVHTVTHYARDAAGNSSGDEPRTALVRIDEAPPLVAFANSQDPREPERIEATVTDPLSGPAARGSIAMRPAGSGQRFAPLPTTFSAGRLVARWNSDDFPTGTYEFTATGYDMAGNAATSDQRANRARFVLSNPLKRQTEIVAGFGGRRLVWQRCSRRDGERRCRREEIEAFANRPQIRAVPYGHGVPYAGRLASPSGSPLGGLPVEIVEAFAAGSDPPLRTTTVQTAADGTFATRLPAGPSRRIEVAFAGSRTLARASADSVRLDVLGGVRMRASAAAARIGGAPVVFSGRIGDLGAPMPPGGLPVELQFRFSGSEWSEFRTVQTDAHGRFRYPYSFSDDDSRGVRFQFRAYALPQDDWPYEPAFSRPVFVTGR